MRFLLIAPTFNHPTSGLSLIHSSRNKEKHLRLQCVSYRIQTEENLPQSASCPHQSHHSRETHSAFEHCKRQTSKHTIRDKNKTTTNEVLPKSTNFSPTVTMVSKPALRVISQDQLGIQLGCWGLTGSQHLGFSALKMKSLRKTTTNWSP